MRKTRTGILITMLATILLLAACGGGGSSSGTSDGNPITSGGAITPDYFPMTANSVWRYNVMSGSTSYESTNLVTQLTSSVV